MKMEKQFKVHALVPMKGHSERVPNKNLRLLGGKPLYHHIIQSLLGSPFVTGVTIDTDSEIIGTDALKTFPKRVRVLKRPQSICGDFVGMNTIIEYDLSQIDGDYFLQTHSTNPLLKTETITEACRTFFDSFSQFDSLFGVSRIQSRLYDFKGNPINHNPSEMLRTQDLPVVYEENSNIYLFSRSSFLKQKRRIGEQPRYFEIEQLESVDIDTEKEFKLAELLYADRESHHV